MKQGEYPAKAADPYGWWFQLRALGYAVGGSIPLAALLVLFLIGARLEWSKVAPIVVLALLWYAMIGATGVRYARYGLPLIPLMAIVASIGLVRLSQTRPRVLVGAIGVIVLLPPLLTSSLLSGSMAFEAEPRDRALEETCPDLKGVVHTEVGVDSTDVDVLFACIERIREITTDHGAQTVVDPGVDTQTSLTQKEAVVGVFVAWLVSRRALVLVFPAGHDAGGDVDLLLLLLLLLLDDDLFVDLDRGVFLDVDLGWRLRLCRLLRGDQSRLWVWGTRVGLGGAGQDGRQSDGQESCRHGK